MTITAAADGSSLGNPGPAGWAWYVDDDCWRAGGWPRGTNNMGELMAVLDLLQQTAHRPEEPLHVLCDSQYVINTITKWMPGWKRKGWRKKDGKPVLNLELVQAIDLAMQGRTVTFEWVRGHAGHAMNEAADQRARAAATAYQSRRAPNAGPGFPGVPVDDAAEPVSGETTADPAETESGETTRAPAETEPGQVTRAPADEPAGAPDQGSLFIGDLELNLPVGDPCIVPVPQDAAGQCVAQERRLLDPRIRRDPALVEELLAEDFDEIGASGRVFRREDILQVLSTEDDRAVVADGFRASVVSPRTVLVTYATSEERGTVQRSSLWVQEQSRDEAGPWRLRHHQGTIEV